MEPPPQPKRQRLQQLQQAAAEEGGSQGTPQPPASPAQATPRSPDDAAAPPADGSSTCSPFAGILLPELLQRVAGFMERNEVACSLRLVCTTAAGALAGPRYATVRLSEPSPSAAFALHWSLSDALRSLTRKQREQLALLTARSGSIANLQALAARGDLPLLSRNLREWKPLLTAAARGGRLELCAWLRAQGVPVAVESVMQAALCGGTWRAQSALLAAADCGSGSAC